MLRGMGFDKSTSIYLASGQIYDSERYMAPLLEMFPLLQTKEMLASAEELAPFQVWIKRYFSVLFLSSGLLWCSNSYSHTFMCLDSITISRIIHPEWLP